jgi:uncharacterized repeat protein (TIGR02543 family)
MPAPSGTVWGSIVGDYGRIGIYTSLTPLSTSPNTYYNLSVEVWFWSKYSVSDSSNTLYYDNLAIASEATTSKGSVSLSTTVASGEGWSTSNQQKIATYSAGYNLETYTQTRYLRARLLNVDRVGGEMKVYAAVTIPALPSFTIAYNANGGNGAPLSQTKYYGHSIKISTAVPTRTGYTFKGWATSASGGVAYASGATYTANAAVTLYAVWQANTYTVSYDANGGTGAPGKQTKTYDVTLALATTVPTRKDYTFKGWGTSASSTTVAYTAGGTYTGNASITLYAIWELTYAKPVIYNLAAVRCDSEGVETKEGTYVLVTFDWKAVTGAKKYEIVCLLEDTEVNKAHGTLLGSDTSGNVSLKIGGGALAVDITYTIEVTVDDYSEKTTVTTTLAGTKFPIDVLAGGGGIAFGKDATLEDTAEFEYDAQFNGNVHGNVFGLGRLPDLDMRLPSGGVQEGGKSFNDFIETGCYAIYANADMKYFKDYPGSMVCGRLEVSSANGYGYKDSEWTYLRQRWIPYQTNYPIYERDITRDASNNWTYGEWVQTTLSKAAAQKVYSKSAITVALPTNMTLGVVNTYTKLRLTALVASTGDRLTQNSGVIKVGANIDYVKVSGLALIKCGSTAGNRHVRIQKVSDGTTTNVAWACVYGTAASNIPCSLPPVIVPVKNGDLLQMVFYTSDSADQNSSGSASNGVQTYLTVEEL